MQNDGDFVGVILLYSVCVILTDLPDFEIPKTLGISIQTTDQKWGVYSLLNA